MKANGISVINTLRPEKDSSYFADDIALSWKLYLYIENNFTKPISPGTKWPHFRRQYFQLYFRE